jgi:hypothetical protein
MRSIYTTLGGGRSSTAAFLHQSDLAVNRHGNFTGQHGGIGMHNRQQQLTLYKGLETFVFRYKHGQEDRLLDVLIESAMDSHTSFDWFDATILSLTLRRQHAHGVRQELSKDNAWPFDRFRLSCSS